MLDLCCGLGGASAAMRAAGWEVISIDNHADVRPSIVADIRALPLRPSSFDLIWISVPCETFSRVRLPWFPDTEPDLSVALAARAILDAWRPRWWAVECVGGSRPWLDKFFGPSRAIYTGHVIWGTFPCLLPQFHRKKSSMTGSRITPRRRHLIKSRMPVELSIALEQGCSRAAAR